MLASVVPIASRQGVYVVLEAALPLRQSMPVGVILVDPEQNRGWVRFRQDFSDIWPCQ